MTKIAISPNANGTGTFTLAAPNSNTDRTLTLPDAGGEVFSQGSILGTVSQSAGVPTGAIIESGSNANGEFVKYADGTMVCLRLFTVVDSGFTQATLPSSFINANYRIVGVSAASSSGIPIVVKITGKTVSTIDAAGVISTNTFANAACDFVAIGRWF